MSLYVGIVSGGTDAENSPMGRAVSKIGQIIQARRRDPPIGSEPSINIVFHLPGNVCPVDFQGLRTSTFSRKRKMLMIQVGVSPLDMSRSDPGSFVFISLREAIGMANPVFRKAKIPFSEEVQLELVKSVEEEFTREVP